MGVETRMAKQPTTLYSAAEYLAMERASSEKHEYAFGEIFAMTGASVTHNRIVTNLVLAIGNQLRGRPCDVFTGDLRLCVEREYRYTYPDMVVVCGEPQFLDNQFDTLLNPDVIVEVLSDSTSSYDRGEKFEQYRGISSFREYLISDQARVHVEVFSKQTDNAWRFWESNSLHETVHLTSVDVSIPIAEIYLRTEFVPGAA